MSTDYVEPAQFPFCRAGIMVHLMAERFPSDDTARVVVRCGEKLRDRLNALAKSNGRSANAEAVFALERWLDQTDWLAAKARGEEVGPWPGLKLHLFDPNLQQLVWHAAQENGRSVDVEIAARIRDSFAPQLASVEEMTKHPPVNKNDDSLRLIIGDILDRTFSSPDLLRRLNQLEEVRGKRTEHVNLSDDTGRTFTEDDLLSAAGEVEQGTSIWPPIVEGASLSDEERTKHHQETARRNFSKRPTVADKAHRE